MDDWNKYEQQRAREDAEIANMPNRVQYAAHLLLTNRALATALLQIDTGHAKYADICKFIDRRVRVLVERAIALKVPEEPSDLDGDDDDPMEEDRPPRWEGDPEATCAGKTQKGGACTKRGTYSNEGMPYCARHFPHSDEYRAQETLCEQRYRESRARYSAYLGEKEAVLKEVRDLDDLVRGLDDMNRTLTDAIEHLHLPMPEVAQPSMPKGPVEIVLMDGIALGLEKAAYPAPSFWLRDDDHRLAVLARRDEGWVVYDLDSSSGGFRTGTGSEWETREDAIRYSYLYNTFYKVRCRRDLSWFASEVHALVDKRVELSSAVPLKTLCAVTVPSIGWHVFERRRGENHHTFVSVYSGHSEAEARWEYASRDGDASLAALLINPSHKIVDHRCEQKLFL